MLYLYYDTMTMATRLDRSDLHRSISEADPQEARRRWRKAQATPTRR